MPKRIKRQERKAPVEVSDPIGFGIVVHAILYWYKSMTAASQALSISRRTLRRLANVQAQTTITRGVYEALECEAQWIDDTIADEGLEEEALAERLSQAVVTDSAREQLREYRSWLAKELDRFGLYVTGPVTGDALVTTARNHYQSPNETITRMTREMIWIQTALDDIRRRQRLHTELLDFERRAKKAGWTTGMARYEIALRHALEPVTSADRGEIERGWKEMLADEDEVVRYLRAAFQKELLLLARSDDLDRANRAVQAKT